VSVAFLLLYWHKYTWKRFERRRNFHLILAAVPAFLFLLVPLIFLTNINLMLFPHRWGEVRGFFSAMLMANVIPRYFHFLAASLAVTGLFLFAYMRRKSFEESRVSPLKKQNLQRNWYKLALAASGLQLLLGPLNLFTLPWHAVTWPFAIIILSGVALALSALFLLWREVRSRDTAPGRYFIPIVAILSLTVAFMATGRHVYRAMALKPFEKKLERNTREYQKQLESFLKQKNKLQEPAQ
jgi:cytochrome c